MSLDDQRARLDRATATARGIPAGAARTGSRARDDIKRQIGKRVVRVMLGVFALGFVLFVLYSIATRNADAADAHRVYVLVELAHADGSAVACDPDTDWPERLARLGLLPMYAATVCVLPVR